MTIEDFINLSYEDLKKLDTDTLKKLVSEKGKSLNKRIRRIERTPEASQVSVEGVRKTGGTFSVKGKTRKQLLAEARREQRFAKGKASTVQSARTFKEEMQRAGAGMTAKEYGIKKRDEYIKKETKKIRDKTGKKPTRTQKKAISEKARSVEEKAKKELDEKVSDYWEEFHKWQEENPTKGSPINVKNNVSYRAFKSKEEQRARFTALYEKEASRREKTYIETTGEEWQKVDRTPFDSDDQETKQIEELIKQTGGIPLL